MVLCKVPDISRYGSVSVDEYSQVVAFQEKFESAKKSGIINAGVYLISQDTIKHMPCTNHSLEHTLLTKLCGNGLYGLIIEAPFIDIGTPSDYAKANHFFEQNYKTLW
jgi:D-glycero-alpha-D-manno-heptose 1-phosphate guanylyltransferase